MMIVTSTGTCIAKAAAAMITASLAFHSGKNMIQTVLLVQQYQHRQYQQLQPQNDEMTSLSQSSLHLDALQKMPFLYGDDCNQDDITSSILAATSSTKEDRVNIIVNKIQQLKRSEILFLYLNHCYVPKSIHEIDGNWNGILLHNNGLTAVTGFLTNQLFGRGRTWNGKKFDTYKMIGTNRFNNEEVTRKKKDIFESQIDPKTLWSFLPWIRKRNNKKINDEYDEDEIENCSIVNEHRFDVSIESSIVEQRQGKESVIIRYNKYQSSVFSPWKTMIDEVRILPVAVSTITTDADADTIDSNNKIEIMIGFGCMAWSGGMLNASPFCLYRSNN